MKLQDAIIKLYKKAATTLPEDIENSLKIAIKKEAKNSLAYSTLKDILDTIELATTKSLQICQDTGTPVFYVEAPLEFLHRKITQAIIDATRGATQNIPLRPNAVNALTEKNTTDNIGFNEDKTELQQPIIYFTQTKKGILKIDLMLKGGGSENIGIQYKLPNKELNANRDFEGIKKCIINAAFKAQGKGCPPYIIGVAIGGSKDVIAKESKKQLLRKINDANENGKLAKIETELKNKINLLGIGPLGLGGKTTALAVKIKALHRHPASFFVDVSFMCWACRRATLIYKKGEAIFC